MSKQVPIIPQHQTIDSAGADLICNVETSELWIEPGETVVIPTGSYVPNNIPKNIFLGLYIRSSIAFKKTVFLSNSVGVIDRDYEDEIKVLFTNYGDDVVTIKQGERIAQLVAQPYYNCFPVKSNRRTGGFGSSDAD